MALVGSISVMLLHERFIAHPTLAPAAEPTKTVVGDRASGRDGSGLSMPERRLLHDSLLAAVELEPGKEALVVDGKRYSYSSCWTRRFARKGAPGPGARARRPRRRVHGQLSLLRGRSSERCSRAGSSSSSTRRRRRTSSPTSSRTATRQSSSPKEASPVLRREPERLRPRSKRRSAEGVPRRSKGWPTSKTSCRRRAGSALCGHDPATWPRSSIRPGARAAPRA